MLSQSLCLAELSYVPLPPNGERQLPQHSNASTWEQSVGILLRGQICLKYREGSEFGASHPHAYHVVVFSALSPLQWCVFLPVLVLLPVSPLLCPLGTCPALEIPWTSGTLFPPTPLTSRCCAPLRGPGLSELGAKSCKPLVLPSIPSPSTPRSGQASRKFSSSFHGENSPRIIKR